MDKKISQLTSATTPLTGTEELAIVQGGVTKKVAASDLGGGIDVELIQRTIGVYPNASASDTTFNIFRGANAILLGGIYYNLNLIELSDGSYLISYAAPSGGVPA